MDEYETRQFFDAIYEAKDDIWLDWDRVKYPTLIDLMKKHQDDYNNTAFNMEVKILKEKSILQSAEVKKLHDKIVGGKTKAGKSKNK